MKTYLLTLAVFLLSACTQLDQFADTIDDLNCSETVNIHTLHLEPFDQYTYDSRLAFRFVIVADGTTLYRSKPQSYATTNQPLSIYGTKGAEVCIGLAMDVRIDIIELSGEWLGSCDINGECVGIARDIEFL